MTKWDEAVVRQGRREMTYIESGIMMLNPVSGDFCVLCGLWEFELALRLCKEMPFGSD